MHEEIAIETLEDVVTAERAVGRGLASCAEQAGSVELQNFLLQLVERTRLAIHDLEALLTDLGASAEAQTDSSSALHREWWPRCETLDSPDDVAVLDSCERGLGAALEAYRNALDSRLPDDVSNVLLAQFQHVLRQRDDVLATRDRLGKTREPDSWPLVSASARSDVSAGSPARA